MSPGKRQVQASAYVFPCDRSDAARALIWNCGWLSSNCTNRWPTTPVAPRIPTRNLFAIQKYLPLRNTYHRGHREKPPDRYEALSGVGPCIVQGFFSVSSVVNPESSVVSSSKTSALLPVA